MIKGLNSKFLFYNCNIYYMKQPRKKQTVSKNKVSKNKTRKNRKSITKYRKMQSGGYFDLGEKYSNDEMIYDIYNYLEFLFEKIKNLPENYHDEDSGSIMQDILGDIFTYIDDKSELTFTNWIIQTDEYFIPLTKALIEDNSDEYKRLYDERRKDPTTIPPIFERADVICEIIIPLNKSLKKHLNINLLDMKPHITPEFLVNCYVYMAIIYEYDLDIATIIDSIVTDRQLA